MKREFRVDVTRIDGSKYYNTFSSLEAADSFINQMRFRVLAISIPIEVVRERDVLSAMLENAEKKSK